MIHHAGKAPRDGAEIDVRDVGRGASALMAKARVVFAIDDKTGVGSHIRQIRTRTNLSKAPSPALFQVCASDAKGTEVNYFKPYDPTEEHRPEAYLEPGEPISTRQFTRRLAKLEDGDAEPSASFAKLAKNLREKWEAQGLIEVESGPCNAKMMRLK
jgi:hypothetical protein